MPASPVTNRSPPAPALAASTAPAALASSAPLPARAAVRAELATAARPARPPHHCSRTPPLSRGDPLNAPPLRHFGRVFVDLSNDGEGGPDGSLRVVFVGDGRAEQREHAVAGEILDRAAESFDGLDDPRHGLAHDEADLLRVQPLRQRRRA